MAATPPAEPAAPATELERLVALGDRGQAEACVDASELLAVPGITEKARRRLAALERRGCELGSGLACNNHGASLANGVGVERDTVAAVRYFARGCELGHSFACTQYANRLIEGRGIARDRPRGVRVLEKACAVPGSVHACYALGMELAPSPSPDERKRAVRLLERACRAGRSFACYRAAGLGSTVEVSKEAAARELAEADRTCASDIAPGCFEVGRFFHFGVGVTPDDDIALKYHRRGCDLSYPASCEAIAEIKAEQAYREISTAAERCRRHRAGKDCTMAGFALLHGQDIAADPALGIALLEIGCRRARRGSSCFELARAHDQGIGGLTRSRPRARALLSRGCKLGHGASCEQSANLLWSAGGAKNRRRAMQLYKRGCRLGDSYSCSVSGANGE